MRATPDLRLIPVVAVVWATALCVVFLPGIAWWWAVGAALLGTGLIAALLVPTLRGHLARLRSPGGVLAFGCFAAAAAAMTVGFAGQERAALAELGDRVVETTAVISSSATTGGDGRLWFDARTERAGFVGRMQGIAAPVRIGVEPLPGIDIDLGAVMHVTGRSMPAGPGERAALVVFATDAEILSPPQGVFAVAAQVRADFAERAMRLPGPGAGLLPGLAVGDTRGVTAELDAAMLTSGLSHLTAVSGANCAIVVGAVFWLAALCGASRGIRVVLALTALAAFVVLVTPEPSVIRAGVMAGLAMLTVMLGRPRAGVGVLALSVTVILIADPWLSATAGFALSTVATAALVVLARPLSRGLAGWMPQPLALAVGVTLSAQLACGPIIALFAEQQSLVGIVANLLAAPAAPIATVVGLLACLATPVPVLADLLTASAWLPAAWIASTAAVTAGLPGAELLLVPGVGGAALVALVGAAIGILLWRSAAGIRAGPLLHRAAAAVLVVATALGGARIVLDGPLVSVTVPDGWSIAACDVGQGDALLVRSAGRHALIDTGPDPEPLDRCLRSLGIDRVDLLVLTHFDLDHVGGVDAVVGRADTVLHGPIGQTQDARMLERLTQGGARIVEASAGTSGTLGAARWRVLWPRARSVAFPPGNDASVVLSFDGGGVPRSLFLGDLSATPQRLLVASGALAPPYPVVKVAHHGSADQDATLYAMLAPSAAIFSAGEDNDYGHPRRETLSLLDAAGADVLRTDHQGRILLGVRDGDLLVWTERENAGGEE